MDRGVSIRYGKNLTTVEQDRNCASCHTGVFPYWADTEGTLVMLPERILHADGTYEREKIRPLDLSLEFETTPTEEQLRELAVSKMDTNQIGIPVVSWKVEFAQLEKTEEYKNKALLERVLLGDTVSVEFPQMNISASARVVETEFDSIRDHYIYVYLGNVRASIADTIASQQKEIEKKPSVSQVQHAISDFTAVMMGAKGGAVRFFDTDGDGQIDEMYVADNEDPTQAVNVWRWNYQGLAASHTGYNGPFVVGMSLEQGILAEFMTACYLNANMITAGVLQSANGNFRFNLETGEILIGGYATKSDLQNAQNTFMTQLNQTNQAVELKFNQIAPNGVVQEVVTSTGYRFDKDGMRVSKEGEELSSRTTHDGFYVDRTDDNVLTANADGVNALNLTVRKYLVAGDHLRIEKHTDGSDSNRVGFFWLP